MKLLMGPPRVVSLELKTLLSSSEFQGIWELQKPRSKRQNIRKRKIFLLLLAVVFPVIMNGSESCTIKKTESWRINAFELWCWRRLLRVICTARWLNQSILKEISSWIFIGMTDAEASILWPLDATRQFIGKDPGARKDWRDNRGWDG